MREFISLLVTLPLYASATNCKGISSCKPQCISFRVERSVVDCERTGSLNFEPSPWNLNAFNASPCPLCTNGDCQNTLPANLTLRVTEEGWFGVDHSLMFDLPHDENIFTYCSAYPCPSEECEVSSQMASKLSFEFFDSDIDVRNIPILSLEMALSVAFIGTAFDENGATRFGPLFPVWMDDPTLCRRVNNISPRNPATGLKSVSYKHGDFGTFCDVETITPRINQTTESIEQKQRRLLLSFFEETSMNSPLSIACHNWFVSESSAGVVDYCNFTGVLCNVDNYVIALDLNGTGLTGTIPSRLTDFEKLQRIQIRQNNMHGEIPSSISVLKHLRQLDLGLNFFNGSIPTELGTLSLLQRLKLDGNRLEGTIPNQICNLTRLVSLDISGNANIGGTLPSCLGDLAELRTLRIQDVGITGAVPIQLCEKPSVDGLIPNLYGCDGVACSAGSFQRLVGRHTVGQACVPCPILSNVIGSTSCRLVDTRRTFAPTTDRPSNPPSDRDNSVSPSLSPSGKGSSYPLILPTSEQPTQIPTGVDDQFQEVSNIPTPLPSAVSLETSMPATATNEPIITELSDDVTNVQYISSAPSFSRTFFDEVPIKKHKSQRLKPGGLFGLIAEVLVVVSLFVLVVGWKRRRSRPMHHINIFATADISVGDETQITMGESVRIGVGTGPVARILQTSDGEHGSLQTDKGEDIESQLSTSGHATFKEFQVGVGEKRTTAITNASFSIQAKESTSLFTSLYELPLEPPVVDPSLNSILLMSRSYGNHYACNLYPSLLPSTQSVSSVSSFDSIASQFVEVSSPTNATSTHHVCVPAQESLAINNVVSAASSFSNSSDATPLSRQHYRSSLLDVDNNSNNFDPSIMYGSIMVDSGLSQQEDSTSCDSKTAMLLVNDGHKVSDDPSPCDVASSSDSSFEGSDEAAPGQGYNAASNVPFYRRSHWLPVESNYCHND